MLLHLIAASLLPSALILLWVFRRDRLREPPRVVALTALLGAVTEAIGTGKPVYWIPLEGRSRRLQRFVDLLTAQGVLRRLPADDAPLESWTYEPPDDTARAAAEIRRRFGWVATTGRETK